MLNFDSDVHTNTGVECEQGLSKSTRCTLPVARAALVCRVTERVEPRRKRLGQRCRRPPTHLVRHDGEVREGRAAVVPGVTRRLPALFEERCVRSGCNTLYSIIIKVKPVLRGHYPSPCHMLRGIVTETCFARASTHLGPVYAKHQH